MFSAGFYIYAVWLWSWWKSHLGSHRREVSIKPVIEPGLCFPSQKKKRISFKDHQKLKTDETELDKELKNFQSCCVRKCYKWLTMQLLLYCRRQYILQPDYNFRRKWLKDEYKRLETGTALLQHGCYGQHRKQCCMQTWAFALRHPGHPQAQ